MDKNYYISADNYRKAMAYTKILNHYFANYEMRIEQKHDDEWNLDFAHEIYHFYCYIDKETEEKVRHDIKELDNPPTLRNAFDGSDYLERIQMHQ